MYFLQIIVRVGLDGVYSVSTRTLVKTEYCFILYFHKDACGNGVLFLLISMEVRNDSNAKITSIPPFMKTEQITWKFVIPLVPKWKMRLFSMSCYIHLYRTSDPRPNATTNVMNRITKNQGLVYADDQKLNYVYCGDEVYFLLYRLVCDFRKGLIIVLKWRQIKDTRWFIRDDFVVSLPPDIRNYCSCKRIAQ